MIGKIVFNFALFQKSMANKNISSRNVSFGITKHTEPVLNPETEEVQFVETKPGSTYLVQGDLSTLRPGRTPDQKERDDKTLITPSRANLADEEEALRLFEIARMRGEV